MKGYIYKQWRGKINACVHCTVHNRLIRPRSALCSSATRNHANGLCTQEYGLQQDGNGQRLQRWSSEQYVHRVVERTPNNLVIDKQS